MVSGATGKKREVVVIGAGIVGVCTALYIRDEGFAVTLVDRVRPGDTRSCSFGNAGVLSVASCVPDCLPDTLRQVPGWLIHPEGPLGIRWPYLPRLAPYLWRMGRAGRADRIAPTADALAALHAPSVALYKSLAAAAGTPELIRESAYIHVFDDSDPFDENALGWRLRRERGVRLRFISGDELREIEPALSPRYRKAVLMEGHGHATDPACLVAALAEHFERRGGRILKDEVVRLVPRSSESVLVETGSALLSAGHVVVAAGVWSARLLAPLGLRLPLESARGYHVTIPEPGVRLTNTVMETRRRVVVTSMDMGLRLAGMLEFGGLSAPPTPRRTAVLERLAAEVLPDLNTEGMRTWMGHRPTLPDSLPALGEVPGHPNILVATGNSHTGLTAAPMSGRIVAGLVAGKPVNVDLAPYAPGRFALNVPRLPPVRLSRQRSKEET